MCNDKISEENTRDEKKEINEISSKIEQITPEIPETSSGKRDKSPVTAITHDGQHIMDNLVEKLQMHEDQITMLQQENIKLHRRIAALYDASENFCQELTALWQENSEMRQEMFELRQEKNEVTMILEDMRRTNNNSAIASTRQSRKPHIFEYDPRACLKGHEIPGFKSFVESKTQEAQFPDTSGRATANIIRPALGHPSLFRYKDIEASHSLDDMARSKHGATPTMEGPISETGMAQSHLEKGKNKIEDIQATQTQKILMPTTGRAEFLGRGHNLNMGPTLTERKRRPYSFQKDKTCEIFHMAKHYGLRLPESKRPNEEKYSGGPNFCLYHRVIGHVIEDCCVFKDWVERKYNRGEIPLPQHVLQNPAPHR